MKVPLNWIREYTDIDLTDEELISRVREQIGEVEEVINLADSYEGVVTAHVVAKRAHPNADKLAIYMLDTGADEHVQVVTGDTTVEEGDMVVNFTPGSKLANNPYPDKSDGIIKATNLRGEMSHGMMASEKELDISNNHEGIMRLPSDAPIGVPFAEYFELDDTILDIENKALTNRPDCFGLIGIAREIAGIQGKQFDTPDILEIDEKREVESDNSLRIEVINDGGDLCPRYMAVSIKGVEIKDSPIWLKSKLLRAGIKPISNVVDITNYIMTLLGQPLHAFDYDKVLEKDSAADDGVVITVRTATSGESLEALDGKRHEFDDTNLLICDSSNPIAIGGVIGGQDTAISESTENIIIEAANFSMYNIRRTSMKLGLFTDAVTRYSKGQDPQQCDIAIHRAMELMQALGGGSIASEVVDVYHNPVQPTQITVDLDRLRSHTGLPDISDEQIIQILDNVELYSTQNENQLIVDIPTYRRDLNIREDIHEEVSRLYGYSNIDITLPKREIHPVPLSSELSLDRKVRRALSAAGLNEVLSYNFTDGRYIESLGLSIEDSYKLINPLSPELQYMRASLTPSLLAFAQKNIKQGSSEVYLYEINKSHNKNLLQEEDNLPREQKTLCMISAIEQNHFDKDYSGSIYYVQKNISVRLMRSLGVDGAAVEYTQIEDEELPEWLKYSISMYERDQSALIRIDNKVAGVIGVLTARAKRAVKAEAQIAAVELDLVALQDGIATGSSYSEPSTYPSVNLDLNFTTPAEVSYSQLLLLIKKQLDSSLLIYSISPVDIYQSDEMKSSGERNITLSLKLQHKDQTLEGEQVNEIVAAIGDICEESLGVSLN